jgi:hypothetical protein
VNGDFETGNTGWTTFVDAAGALFEQYNSAKAGYSGNLVADFSAVWARRCGVNRAMSVQEER